MEQHMKSFIRANEAALFQLVKDLCGIPAPSHFEHKRAAFCKEWLEGVGASGVYIDDALNVVLPIQCENSNQITVVVAHTDTVFPDLEPMPFSDEGEIWRCPSICDDTASLAVLLMCAKFLIENQVRFPKGLLLVCNSGEEGLGNLKGTRQIFQAYAGRISKFISFDSLFTAIADRCVGSHRYEVNVKTEGGHSYQAYGKKNAIAQLSGIIGEIYKIEVSEINNSKTTYNVGTISGGTSVNTIAQSASMVCEYRSDNVKCLTQMQEKFLDIFDRAQVEGVEVSVREIGQRPCMADMDTGEIEVMYETCRQIVEEVTKQKVRRIASSTDCNIPLSLGIPSICVGVCDGGGRHTREEWLVKDSLPKGLEIGIKVILALASA